MAASVGKSRYRSEKERPRVLRASVNRAPPHGGGVSRGVLSSASDDDGGGSEARLREQPPDKGARSAASGASHRTGREQRAQKNERGPLQV